MNNNNQDSGGEKKSQEMLASYVDTLEERWAKGLQFADMLGFTNQQGIQENQVLLHSLLELLISKGIIRLHELEERKREVSEYFSQREEQAPKVYLVERPDKYTQQEGVYIGCWSVELTIVAHISVSG
jgi:hypothetical protein